jgi:hypothetical protein
MNPYSPPAPHVPGYPGPVPPAQETRGAASEGAIELLRQTRPWVVLLGALWFLGSSLMLISGVAVVAVGLVSSTTKIRPALGLVYLPFAFHIYPAIKMWTYAGAISRLEMGRTMADLDSALARQKSVWRWLGVATIAMMALCAIGVIAFLGTRSKLR